MEPGPHGPGGVAFVLLLTRHGSFAIWSKRSAQTRQHAACTRVRSASIDSVCTTCFETIASNDSEDELTAYEVSHRCDPFLLFSRASFASTRLGTPAGAQKAGAARPASSKFSF